MMKSAKDTVILVTRNGMGSGDAALQLKLMGTWLNLLLEEGNLPSAICFYTDGVRLAVEGSPVLDELKALEAAGVRLILCTTCLNTYGLTDLVRVGIVGGMSDIITAMFSADKVISI